MYRHEIVEAQALDSTDKGVLEDRTLLLAGDATVALPAPYENFESRVQPF